MNRRRGRDYVSGMAGGSGDGTAATLKNQYRRVEQRRRLTHVAISANGLFVPEIWSGEVIQSVKGRLSNALERELNKLYAQPLKPGDTMNIDTHGGIES